MISRKLNPHSNNSRMVTLQSMPNKLEKLQPIKEAKLKEKQLDRSEISEEEKQNRLKVFLQCNE
jgi:hypothetical protein